jgi:GntR family transcriptional regulator
MTHHSSMLFSIATGSSDPIYRQLVEQARRLIAAGALAPGDLLPSVREVAQALAVNPMTVSKAYNMLEGEGLFQRLRGLGMQVAGHGERPPAREELLRPALQRAAQQARELELDPESVLSLFNKILKETR